MKYSFNEILTDVDKSLLRTNTESDNIFDIGTRGFYENPFTGIFAYIISLKIQYNHRNKFIQSFL
ncbi:hypothetical protein LX80_02101 [Hydrotalea sandarakina]|jgi:hypothetical protein|uniref:Uncharacterized protein n=1 Tax=Hydrotalea sandarakina TaxID=1004304 RepID=A0A2W7S3R1_9BACT|nr:hypothetical protein LX80_02101 [Hydrotalea sandarakina]